MDYGYDKAKEDDRNERRFRSLPRYTPEQLGKADADELRRLIKAIEVERRKEQTPEYIRILDSWDRALNRMLKNVENETKNKS